MTPSKHGQPRPRILYVCSIWPVDRAYGGQMRTLQIARALQQIGDVTLVVVGAQDTSAEVKAATAQQFTVASEIGVRGLRGGRWRSWWRGFLDPGFVNVHGLVANPEGERALLDLLPQFDLLWFSRLRTANYFSRVSWPGAVVDIDDFPSAIEASAGRTQASASKRWRARLRTSLLRWQERRLPRRFDTVLLCSDADRSHLHTPANRSVHVVPNGYARLYATAQPAPAHPPRIGFIGLFDYLPNLDGVRWFVRECLPLIQQQVPALRVRLVGSRTDGALRPDHPAVDGLGWIDDATDEINSWSLMIVPVRIGGGTRIKIAEAFSRRCPVVSTAHGAYGYEVHDGVELRLADTPQAFADACVWILQHRAEATAMAQRAHQVFLDRWTWDAIATRVHAIARQALHQHAALVSATPTLAPRAAASKP